MKKFISLLLVFALSICLCNPVYAAGTDTDDTSDTGVSDIFIQVCDLFFAGKGEAYDHNSTDVTATFYNAYIDEYLDGNYVAIKNGCITSGISCIATHSEAAIQPRLELTRTYEDMRYHLVTQEGFPYDGKSWGFVVWATGSFTYHDSTFQIASYTYPNITYTYDQLGAAFTGSVTANTITGPLLTNNRTTLTFTVETTHQVSVPIPGVDLITGTIGPFETESVFEFSV